MQITVKIYGSLSIGRFECAEREYPAGTRVLDVVRDLGIGEEYLIRLRNGVHADFEDRLEAGDTLSLLPMLDGG